MVLVQTASFDTLQSYIGKVIRFTSDCEIFDCFSVDGLLIDVINTCKNQEYIFKVKRIKDNKLVDKITEISSNMSNLGIHLL
jgi:hypothetical protein